jgi:hypothetical protein
VIIGVALGGWSKETIDRSSLRSLEDNYNGKSEGQQVIV